ncbi:Dynamin-like protein ARC5 [Porphyridium purpureum]|uniref:Dynamin-like protein ARC5 n=1 Tax=Porphyridium purpureum TaxID=35688 RepID=A0A5J4Z5P7_PORPP|nr:Dynamin-like protein ARC5 [Porphyridium purpureum]|eukprot:POR4894..scf295_1
MKYRTPGACVCREAHLRCIEARLAGLVLSAEPASQTVGAPPKVDYITSVDIVGIIQQLRICNKTLNSQQIVVNLRNLAMAVVGTISFSDGTLLEDPNRFPRGEVNQVQIQVVNISETKARLRFSTTVERKSPSARGGWNTEVKLECTNDVCTVLLVNESHDARRMAILSTVNDCEVPLIVFKVEQFDKAAMKMFADTLVSTSLCYTAKFLSDKPVLMSDGSTPEEFVRALRRPASAQQSDVGLDDLINESGNGVLPSERSPARVGTDGRPNGGTNGSSPEDVKKEAFKKFEQEAGKYERLPPRKSQAGTSARSHSANGVMKPIYVPVPNVPLPSPSDTYTEMDDELLALAMDFSHAVQEASKLSEDMARELSFALSKFSRLVIVGPQGSGKSTFLEYFTRMRCTHKAAGLGTKRPIVYHVVRDPKALEVQIRIGPLGPLLRPDELVQQLAALQPGTLIQNEAVHVYVRSCEAFTVTIVDLPGLILPARNTVEEQLADEISSLALEYMCDPTTLILGLRSGIDDWEAPNSRILEQTIEKADPKLFRTVVCSVRMLGSPGLATRTDCGYFEGLSAKGNVSFPNAHKFYTDVDIDRETNSPKEFPINPSDVQHVMDRIESALDEALGRNENQVEIREATKHKLGLEACAMYVRSLFVQDPATERARLESGLLRFQQLLQNEIGLERERFPFKTDMEKHLAIQAAAELFARRIAAIAAGRSRLSSVALDDGRTTPEENDLTHSIFVEYGATEGWMREPLQWPDVNLGEGSSFRFKWGREQMYMNGRGGEREMGGIALERLRLEGREGLLKMKMPVINLYNQLRMLAGGLGAIAAVKNPGDVTLHALTKVMRQIFPAIVEYFVRREFVIMKDILQLHAFSFKTDREEDTDHIMLRGAAKMLDSSELLRGKFLVYMYDFMLSNFASARPIVKYVAAAKLLQYNNAKDPTEGMLDPSQPDPKLAAINLFNKQIELGREKFLPDFESIFHVLFAEPIIPGETNKTSQWMRDKVTEEARRDPYFVGNVFGAAMKESEIRMQKLVETERAVLDMQSRARASVLG